MAKSTKVSSCPRKIWNREHCRRSS